MKANAFIFLLMLAFFAGCRKEDPFFPPYELPQMDSLPFENTHLKMELVTKNAPEKIQNIHFTNQNQGCAIDEHGKIFRSDDGGLNWTVSFIPDKANSYYDADIEFLNDHLGIAVEAPSSYDGNTKILKTTDGGITWNEIWSDSLSWSSVTLVDSLHFIAAGSDHTLISSDGGNSWKVSDSLNEIMKVTHNNNYSFGFNSDGGIFRSSDFGETWVEVSNLSHLNLSTTLSFFGSHGYTIDFDTLFSTNDDGASWQRTALPDSANAFPNFNIHAISLAEGLFFTSWGFLDYDITVYCCAVIETYDGGVTLEKRILLSNIGIIAASSFYDDKNGYAIDYFGNLMKVTVK